MEGSAMTPTTATEAETGYGWYHLFPEFNGTRRFTTTEYRKMIDAGILSTSDHVELLDGYIVYNSDRANIPTVTLFPEWRLLRRWSPTDVQHMVQVGVIGEDERLELLDGHLVLKMPENLPHRSAVSRLTTRLAPKLPDGWWLQPQYPVSLGINGPIPDGVILRGSDVDYDRRKAGPPDFGIAIEVSDSSLATDRGGKGKMYAREGVPVYWIINVTDRQIEVYSDPDATANPPTYRTRTDYKPGDVVPITLDGATAATIPVAELVA
jgi:Uma2 family endonuclease